MLKGGKPLALHNAPRALPMSPLRLSHTKSCKLLVLPTLRLLYLLVIFFAEMGPATGLNPRDELLGNGASSFSVV